MKSIIRSIKPYWLYLILIGKKKCEIGKNIPQDPEWDRIVYLYCSKDLKSLRRIPKDDRVWMAKYLGKIACYFKCDMTVEALTKRPGTTIPHFNTYVIKEACMSNKEALDYAKGKTLYAWSISNLTIYNQGAQCPGRPPQSWKYINAA